MTNPDNVGGLVWYVCTSCMLMVQLPSDTPTLGRCQCSPKGWSLRRAKLPKGYELCRAAPAGGEDLVRFATRMASLNLQEVGGDLDDRIRFEVATFLRSAPAGSGEVTDGCTESNCERCATAPHARGELRHAGIGSYPDVTHIADKAAWLERAASKWEVGPMAINPADALRLRELAALLRKLQQGAHAGKVVAHRLHTPGGKWQWIDGEPSLGTLDLWKSYGWTLEYAYAASQGQEGWNDA